MEIARYFQHLIVNVMSIIFWFPLRRISKAVWEINNFNLSWTILVCSLHELYFDLGSWKHADVLRVSFSCYILLYHEQIVGVDKASCDVEKISPMQRKPKCNGSAEHRIGAEIECAKNVNTFIHFRYYYSNSQATQIGWLADCARSLCRHGLGSRDFYWWRGDSWVTIGILCLGFPWIEKYKRTILTSFWLTESFR